MRIKALPRKIRMLSSVLVWLLLTGPLAFAQSNVVSGEIKDPSGQTMPGINVIIKGTTKGTSTDANGKFSLAVNPDDVLIMSFIGYKTQEFPVGSRTTFDVTMAEDVTTLKEVVLVGYGEMRKVDLTSAQTSVSSKDIERTVNTTLEQALQGRAAGVLVTQNTGQPGGGMSVNIRGISSINGSTEPLYVIDGIQIGGAQVNYGNTSSSNPLAGINPSDIENMQILQGPSATAIYGSRATNGVILITTKRGKIGEPKISYTFLNNVQTTPKHQPVMDLRQYATMVNEFHQVAGGEVPTEFLDPSLLGKGTDWQKELFRNAYLGKHQLSLSGGTEKATYYLSGEYFNQDGVALGSGFKRYSFRANVDTKLRDWLTVGTNLNFSQTQDKLTASQENVIYSALGLTPQVPVHNIDGSWGGGDIHNGANQFAPVNPVAIANLTTNNQTTRQFMGGLNVAITLMKGLVFRSNFTANVQVANSTYYIPTYSIGWAKNVSASLRNGSNLNTSWLWNQQLDFSKLVGRHNISATAIHEAQASGWDNSSGSRTGFLTNNIYYLDAGDPKTASNSGGAGGWALESFIGRVNYNYGDRYLVMGTVRTDGHSNFGANNRWGVFPSLSAAWRVSQEAFFKNVTAINELKLRFETGLTGNPGGGGIYSPLSPGATPTGTGFLPNKYSNPNLKWEQTNTVNFGLNLNVLQNRIQFEFDVYNRNTTNLLMDNPLPWYMGTNGTGSVGSPTVNIGAMQTKGWSFTMNTTNINSGDFRWETTFNISSFKSVVKKFYSDAAFVDRTSWWMNNWTQRSAVGEQVWQFRGYEQQGLFTSVSQIEASALPVDNNGNKLPIDQTNNGVWVGDVKFKDVNGDGIIDDRDQKNIGNPWPKMFGGLTNNFYYKGFELSVLLTSTYGNDIYNYAKMINTNPNNINVSRNLLVHASEYARPITDANGNAALSNPGTDVPRISYGPNGNATRMTDKWVENGSYLRVKNISLTYRLPAAFLSKQNVIKGVRVTIGAQNIYTFTKYTGYDPEVGSYVGRDSSPTTQSVGVDYGRYPITPIYTATLGLDF